MTIAKHTKRAKQAIENAKDIRGYSLCSNFDGHPLAQEPVVWGGPIVNNQHTQLVRVTQSEFLMRELNSRNAKLTSEAPGRFTLSVHGNLWYTFISCDHDFLLCADDLRRCSKCRKLA